MKFSKTTLKSGLRLITVPKKDSQAVTILVLVEAGSKYETKHINGLSHFLEHMCFKGTERRPQTNTISTELDSIGAQYNAFTGQEYTGYYATVWPKHFSRALDIIADMYLNPIFKEEDINRERGVIIEEMNMYEDMPHRDVQELFQKLLYGDQPAGWPVIGLKETVNKMTSKDFINYRNDYYVGPATTVVIAGNFDSKKVNREVSKQFELIAKKKSRRKQPVKEKQVKPAIVVKHKLSDQSHLVLGFRGFKLTDKRTPAMDVLATVLGGGMSSRLFQKIRDELGAAYYVRANNDTATDHGSLEVSVGADTSRVKQIIEVILAECKRLTTETVSDQELRKVKDYMIGNLYLDLETSSHVAFYYGMQEVLKHQVEPPEVLAKKIEAVTAADVKRVAKTVFTNERLNLALIGPFKSSEEFAGVLRI